MQEMQENEHTRVNLSNLHQRALEKEKIEKLLDDSQIN